MAYNGKPAGRKCRFHNCLSRKQQAACKACPRNKKGQKKRSCRRAQCSAPAKARQAKLTAKGVIPAPVKAKAPTAKPAAPKKPKAVKKSIKKAKARAAAAMKRSARKFRACKSKCSNKACRQLCRQRRDARKARIQARKRAAVANAKGKSVAAVSGLTLEQRRARNMRCISEPCATFNGKKEGRVCRYKDCLNAAQQAECKACPRDASGQKDKACRRAKCSAPAKARQHLIRTRRNKRCLSKVCTTYNGKPEGRKCRYHNCLHSAAQHACKSCARDPLTGEKDLNCRKNRCSKPSRERQNVLRNRKAAKLRDRMIAKVKRQAAVKAALKQAKAAANRSARRLRNCKAQCQDKECRQECKKRAEARRARIQARKRAAIAKAKAKKSTKKAAAASTTAPAALTLEQRRARNMRCISHPCRAFDGKKEGRVCRFNDCLNAAQRAECKACPRDSKGRKDKACRRAKCSTPAKARQAKIRAARNARCLNAVCVAYNGKPEGRKCRFHNCLSREQQAKCKACPRNKKGQKKRKCRRAQCSNPARARQDKLRGKAAAKPAVKTSVRVKQAMKKAKAALKRSGRKFQACKSKCKDKACRKECRKRRDARRARIQQRKTAAIAKAKAAAAARRAAAAAAGGLTAEQRRARNLQCISSPCHAYNGKKEGRMCRYNHCLNAAQQAECKACPRDSKGQKDKACRRAKCSAPAKARQAKIRAARNARCLNAVCTAYDGKPEGRKCRFHNCLSRKQQKSCKACPRNKNGQKKRKCRRNRCSNPARARQAQLRAKGVVPAPVKPATSATPATPAAATPATPAPTTPATPASPVAAAAAPVRKARKVFWYKPEGLTANEDRRVLRWEDSVPAVNADGSSRRRAGVLVPVGGRVNDGPNLTRRNYAQFMHHGFQSKQSFKLGNKFDVFAVLKFTGDPQRPENRWGAATAFMLNAPGLTPVDPTQHAEILGGVGVAVSEGQLRIVAEGRGWGVGGANIKGDATYIVRLRRTASNVFELFVGDSTAPAAILHSDAIEGPDARLKLGVSDALWYGWEGVIQEVVGFRGNLSQERIEKVYRRLTEDHHL